MQETDESLLQSFATGRDEKTFRALTGRYLGLIFHTALRRTGNRQMAEEVSQNVLCALAGKAGSLARHPERLAPWLHRATVFESLKAMRSESSHQRRKQLTHPDEIPGTDSAESAWSDALPVLDASLDKLPEADRTVLLLHFYEGRSFPQIARALGKSAEAVQKQSRRALEKLSRLLRARGVALSVTGLAVGLTAEMAKAAPLPIGASAASALASSSAPTIHPLAMILSKPKVLFPSFLLVCAIPLTLQQAAISGASARNQQLLAENGSLPATGASAFRSPRTAGNNGGPSHNFDFYVLADELDEAVRLDISPGQQPNIDAFRKKLGSLDDEGLIRLIREGTNLTLESWKKRTTLRALVFQLSERDPSLALETAINSFNGNPSFDSLVTDTQLGVVLARWGRKDPVAAYGWLRKQQEAGRFNGLPAAGDYQEIGGSFSDVKDTTGFAHSSSESMQIPLCNVLIGLDSPLAREMIGAVPEGARPGYLRYVVTDDLRPYQLALGGTRTWDSEEDAAWPLRFLAIAREITPKAAQEELLRQLLMARHFSLLVPDARLREFFNQGGLDETEKGIAARYFAESLASIKGDAEVAQKERAKLRSWIDELAPGSLDGLVGNAREKECKDASEFAKRRLQALKAKPQADDEELVRVLSRDGFQDHLPDALEQADRIKNPEKRRQVIEHLNTPEK